jgi:hypothetical protein
MPATQFWFAASTEELPPTQMPEVHTDDIHDPWVERPPAVPSMRRHGQMASQLQDSK